MTGTELREAFQTALEAPEDSIAVINRWLARGDGVAVYENVELGHPWAGHRQYVSFGGPEAQIPGDPPTKMPDIGPMLNWRYQLVGTYRGEAL